MNCTARFTFAALLTIGALLAQGPPPHGGPGGPGFDGPPVTGAPFSAIRINTRQQTLSDGNQIQETRTEKVYRDADGRTRTEATMSTPSGATHTMITIVDPVAGFVAHLNPTDSTAMKDVLPAHSSGGPKLPPQEANAPDVMKKDLGQETVAGLTATGTSITRTIPAGAMGNANPIVETREVWVSTALKIPVKMTNSDPEHGNSSMVLSNLIQGAPDASLFQIPSGYTVKEGHGGFGPHGAGGPPPPPDGSL